MKQSLRQMRKEYGFMFPAKMQILHDKRWHYFTSPSQAEEFIRKMKKVNTNQAVQKESPAETGQEALSENFDWKKSDIDLTSLTLFW